MWFLYLYDFKLFLGHVRQKVELLWCLGSRSPGGLGQTAVFHNSISYFTFVFRLRQPGCLGESTSFSGWDRIGKSRSSQICRSHLVVRALYFSTQTSWSRILPDCYIWQIWSKELTFIFCRKIDCWIWLIITLCLWPCVVVFIKQSFGSFIHSSETFP